MEEYIKEKMNELKANLKKVMEELKKKDDKKEKNEIE